MFTTRNVGGADRVLRALIGAGFLALAFTRALTGTPGLLAILLGAVMLATAALGVCPLYAAFGFSTRPAPPPAA